MNSTVRQIHTFIHVHILAFFLEKISRNLRVILVLDEIEFFFDTLAGLGDSQLHRAPRRSLKKKNY
jgi:hypothetical protein